MFQLVSMLVTNYYQSNVITCPGFTRFKTQITRNEFTLKRSLNAPGGGVLPIMAYTGRIRPKGVPFSGFRYMN